MCGWQGKLSHYFGQPLSHAQLAEAFVEIDADNSGTIDMCVPVHQAAFVQAPCRHTDAD